MMSKFRKWHLREPKFAKFPGGGGAYPRTPLEDCAFGANNYSLFPSHGVGISEDTDTVNSTFSHSES